MRSATAIGAVLRSLLLMLATVIVPDAVADPASADAPLTPQVPDRRISIGHVVGASLNPLGAEYDIKPGVQYRLWKSDDLLLKETFTFLGAYVRINPVASGIGPLVEWQPLAVLNLRARAEVIGDYGILGYVQSWRSPYDNYSDTAQNARTKAAYATWGWHAVFEPAVQARVGPIAFQNRFTLDYWDIRLHNGDTIWYDAGPDHALPGKGWTLRDEANLVYLAGPLTLGLNFRYAAPLFTQAQFRPGEDPHGVDDSNARLGLLAAYTLFDHGYTAFNQPSVFVLVGWWLHHRYRTGVDVPQSVPFLGAGFAFQQDFPF